MGIFDFLKKKPKERLVDFSEIHTDIHSHILPGLDDGCQNIEESIAVIKRLNSLGYKRFVATPHIMSDAFKNDADSIFMSLTHLNQAIKENNIPVEIHTAAEYYIDYSFIDMMQKDVRLETINEKYLLFELPFIAEPDNLFRIIFDMQTAGYKLIIAHPERYTYWHNSYESYVDLKDRDILFQINMGSLLGENSVPVRKMAERLIEEDMVDLLGSDAHVVEQFDNIEKLLSNPYFIKLVKSGRLLNKTLLDG